MKTLTTTYSLALVGLLVLTACAGASTTPVTSSVPSVETSAPQVESSTTPSAQVSSNPPSSPTSSVHSPASSVDGPGIIEVQPGSERPLHLTDAYDASSMWKEGSFQAVTLDPSQAIGAKLGCASHAALEFRFSNTDGTFRAEVAQDINSASSSNTLEWSMLVDGQRTETEPIAFKETAEFSTPLAGVAVVRLETKISGKCQKGATALITSAKIDG